MNYQSFARLHEMAADRQQSLSQDQALRDLVVADPERGWSEFEETHGAFIRRLIRRFHLSKEDEEEVFQEVSHALIKNEYKALRVWDGNRCNLRSYLAVIVSHTTINFVKSHFHSYQKRKVGPLEEISVSPTLVPSERLQRIQSLQTLNEAFEKLIEKGRVSSKDRLIVALRLRGLSFREISNLLGLDVSYLTARVSRIKPVLKSGLEAMGVRLEDFL